MDRDQVPADHRSPPLEKPFFPSGTFKEDPKASAEEVEHAARTSAMPHLTVSSQLEAEIYASALSRVYTFGPCFRAENSRTTRHLAEFWMLEPEVLGAQHIRLERESHITDPQLLCVGCRLLSQI